MTPAVPLLKKDDDQDLFDGGLVEAIFMEYSFDHFFDGVLSSCSDKVLEGIFLSHRGTSDVQSRFEI